MTNRRKRLNDILLIIFFAIITVIGCVFLVKDDSLQNNLMVTVKINGSIVESIPLDDNITIDKKLNVGNHIIIKDGYVYLKDANCPDELCVKQGKISDIGQSIVCLPHRLVIEITSKDNNTDNGLDVQP